MKRCLLIALALMLLLAACSDWEFWSEADSVSTGTGTTGGYVKFTGGAPSSFSATKAMYGDSVNLTWSSVTAADYYEVFRMEVSSSSVPDADDSGWAGTVYATVSSTSYNDTDVEAGCYYAYRVRARSYSELTTIGDYSSISVGWTLSPPASLSATKGDSSSVITISWTGLEASTIKGYEIQWSTARESGWSTLTSVTASAASYSYSPSSRYSGQALYFRLYSISRNGSYSDASDVVLGYTYDEENSPDAYELTVSEGLYSSYVSLEWEADEDTTYEWGILRSSSTESDTEIYYGSLSDDEGVYSYLDTSAEPGVEYSYTVYAVAIRSGNEYYGTASDYTSGYLLSPPGIASGYGVTEGDGTYGHGFSFTLTAAPGESSHSSDWTYEVSGSEDGENWTVYETLSTSDDKSIYYPYDGDSNPYIYFTTRTLSSASEGDSASAYYHETSYNSYAPLSFPAPATPSGFSVSENLYTSSLTADDAGNYPLVVTVDEDSSVVFYNVKVWDSEPSSVDDEAYQTLTLYPETDSGVSVLTIEVDQMITGWTYFVSVQGEDYFGRQSEWSSVKSGYGAITDAKLMLLMQVYATKSWSYVGQPIMTDGPWGSEELNTKWKNSDIAKKVNAAGLSSIGSSSQSGIVSGALNYSTTASYSGGISGVVNFTYTNYCDIYDEVRDEPFFVITGWNTMNVDLSASGSTEAEYELDGLFPAEVLVTNDTMKIVNDDAVGYYLVTQSGRSTGQVYVYTEYDDITIYNGGV